MTYRERREARAERLREWADKREARADDAYQRSHELADVISFGQPILVGHHSERGHRRHIDKIDSAMRESVDSGRKAEAMASRADEIERQAAAAIYSDDPDAIERLTEKIDGLEAERDRIKRYNASCRKAAKAGEKFGDLSILLEHEQRDLLRTAEVCPYQIGKGGSMPAYKLSNLGGNIKRLRDRLASLQREREHGPRDRTITARFDSECADCGAELKKGETIRYNRQQGARCVECKEQSDA